MTKVRKWLLSAVGGVLTAAPMSWAQNSHPPAHVGRIVGNLDGISQDGDHYLLSGWACQQGQTKSIAVQLFVEQPASNAGKLAPFLAETANLYSEPAVNQACQDRQDGKHRFLIVLPYGYGPASHLRCTGRGSSMVCRTTRLPAPMRSCGCSPVRARPIRRCRGWPVPIGSLITRASSHRRQS
jgi:hypothetical protein